MDSDPEFPSASGRKTDRKQFEVTVQFRAGTKRATIKLLDLSPRGARVQGVFLVREGDRFWLKLPSIEAVEARVAWVEEFEFGCEFLRPLSPLVFEAITR